jgi:hypothetical protein
MSTLGVPSSRSASENPGGVGGWANSPDVVDLTSARQARQPQSAEWFCPACDLVATGFTPTECAYLAAVHDQVQHRSRQTARVVVGAAALPPGEGVGADLGIGA